MSRLLSTCQLSAAVMVYNGIETIGSCLAGLAFCDEIVVVDDVSTDGTWEYLQTQKVKSVQHRHTSFTAQRRLANSLASGEWVLIIDADEYVSPQLARAIRRAIADPQAPDGFYLTWKNLYPRTLRGEWHDRHARLFRAERCKWVDTDDPHSPMDLTGLRLESLGPGYVEHAPLPNLASCLRKSINRSLIISTQQRAAGRKVGAGKLLLSTCARWLKVYFGQGAWRYGADGFVMASLWAFEAFTKNAFLIERPQEHTEKWQDGGPGSYPSGAAFVSCTDTSSRDREAL